MLTFDQKQNLFRAAIFYKPVSTPRNAPLAKTFWYIGEDLSGKVFKAEVALLRDVAAPILTLSVALVSSTPKTYGELVSEGYISHVPHGCLADAQVHLNGITVQSPQASIGGLPPAGTASGDAVFYWDCRIEGNTPRVLCAGEFIVTGGVTT